MEAKLSVEHDEETERRILCPALDNVPQAIHHLLCILRPPVAVLLTGQLAPFLMSLLLTLFDWQPGMIHAFFVANDERQERRTCAIWNDNCAAADNANNLISGARRGKSPNGNESG